MKSIMFDNASNRPPNGPIRAVNVPARQWNRVYAKESGTVLMESKIGKWEPLGEEDILTV